MNTIDWEQHADASGGPDACWLWLGTINPDGYAAQWFGDMGRTYQVARVALASKLGRPIGPGLMALHHCDNRKCVNPAHLYEGSAADNGRDKALRGRSRNGYTIHTLGSVS